MTFVVYDLEELDKKMDCRCLWCLVISSAVIDRIKGLETQLQNLNIFETEKQRDNSLKYWRRQHILTETVFFLFEIPIDIYLKGAEKQI